MSNSKKVAKEAKAEKHTIKCPVCSYSKRVELSVANIPCPVCKNTMKVRMNFAGIGDYVVGASVTASGRGTVDNGDSTAERFRGASDSVTATLKLTAEIIDGGLKEFMAPGAKKQLNQFSGTTEEWLSAKYVERGLNNGMIRMNCGNIVRNAEKRKANIG